MSVKKMNIGAVHELTQFFLFLDMMKAFFFLLLLHSFLWSQKPNVIFILVDDLGWMDVGYNNSNLDTPNINRLAKEGMVFNDAYAATVCSPSRAAILTGKSPARLKLTSHIPGMGLEGYTRKKMSPDRRLMEAEIIDHLPLSEVTFAEVLKNDGYKTGFFGKWHLAGEGSVKTSDGVVNEKWHPQYQGFDVNIGGCAYGMPRKSYYSPYKNAEIKDGPEGEYLTDRLVDDTLNYIEQNKEDPFLAYLSFYTIHTPLKPKKEIAEKTKDNYVGMIYCLDEAIGKLLNQLDEWKLRENTIIVFTSDNGGLRNTPPLRGYKGQAYEGGIRVPLIYSWKNHLPTGRTSQPVACEDFFPTILELTKVDMPKDLSIDGNSYLPLLYRQTYKPKPLYQHFPHHRSGDLFNGSSTLRLGDYKLIWWHRDDSLELFNLNKDFSESQNLAQQQPERAQAMKAQLQSWLKKVDANMARVNPDYKG